MINLGKTFSKDIGPYYISLTTAVAKARTNKLLSLLLRKKLDIEQAKLSIEIDRFINSPRMNKKYNMESKDEAGWQIYHSLADKFSIHNKALNYLVK